MSDPDKLDALRARNRERARAYRERRRGGRYGRGSLLIHRRWPAWNGWRCYRLATGALRRCLKR